MPTNIELLLNSINSGDTPKVLTKKEEFTLGTLIQNPDTPEDIKKKSINTLVLRNIYLVLKLVHKYKRTSFDFEDLVGYGILGLFSAANKYDPQRSNRFASYARHWIKESVMKAIREYSGIPKIPVYLVKDLWAVTRIIKNNEDISDEALATQSGLPLASVQYLKSLLFKTVQFDPEYIEISHSTPEQEYISKERDFIFKDTLEKVLTPEESIVLNHFCALNGCKKMTFARIEQHFNIKNARKLKVTAFAKLSKDPNLKLLHEDI